MSVLDDVRHELGRGNKQSKLSISHHPELLPREHLLVQTAAGAMESEIEGYSDYGKVYKVYSWVRKAVAVIKDNIAPLPLYVVNADGEPLPTHPLTELFNYVNDTDSASDLWEKYYIHMMLGGEAFFEFVPSQSGRQLTEIWARRPDYVGVLPDKSEERALYPRPAGYAYGEEDNIIEPELMWHDKFYHPLNPWRGIAPITAVRHAIVIDLFAATWSRTFLQKGARPDYAVIAPQGVTRSEKEDLEQELIARYRGANYLPIILEEGISDVKPLSFPPKDIEWLEQRRFSRDEVGAVFGIPDEVMGYGRDTYENMDAAHRWLWLLTLVPLTQRRDRSLTKYFSKFRADLRPGERLMTDLSDVTAIQEDLLPKMELAKSLWSMGTPFNTIDERLGLDIGPIPGGDVGYLPANLLAIGTAPVEPPQVQQEALTPVHHLLLASHNQIRKQIQFGGEQHKALWDRYDRRLNKHADPMQRELRRQFQRQQSETLRKLRQIQGRDIRALTIGQIFDFNAEVTKFVDQFEDNFERAIEDFGREAFEEVLERAGERSVTVWRKQDPELIGDFDLADPLVSESAHTMSIKFANDINETTQSRMKLALRPILDTAAAEGWSIPQIQRAIHSEISTVFDVRKSLYETERIARTEMNKAANDGKINGWRQSKVVAGKGWLAALDERTRDSHAEAHDTYQKEPIPLEEDFQVGGGAGPAPGQIGIAGEDINCRCTMTAELIER